MDNKIRLLIADDHAILRDGIVSLLQGEPAFTVSGTAGTGYEVMDLIAKNDFDVLPPRYQYAGIGWNRNSPVAKRKKPGIKIIMLTTYNDREIISELVHIGVSGYLLKNSDKQELTEAVNKVMKGRHYFSEEVENIILQGLSDKKSGETITLTERELEVMHLLAREYTNDKIATALHISYRTVETHRKNVMQKTKAHNLADC
ncbi:MAG: response regulator transcription factor [Chitinophagaceae bacterium]|nr:response regulator transcription factor [Chitinophagaceae bacterium]